MIGNGPSTISVPASVGHAVDLVNRRVCLLGVEVRCVLTIR